MNLTGTKRILDLCKSVKHLNAVIHLSTAFCYCDQEVLLEKVYDCPHNPEDLIRCAEWMDVKTLDQVTPNLLYPHPNTYTYSKRLAEILVQKEYPNLPVCIARPSIGKYNNNKFVFILFAWFRIIIIIIIYFNQKYRKTNA